jgi:hypothetical protein
MVTRIVVCLLAVVLSAAALSASKSTFRSLKVPLPGSSHEIATRVGGIQTFVTGLTVSRPAQIRRLGLTYEERRGEIEGVGWGGIDIAGVRRNQHYKYRVSYVLRVPPGWDGTLLVFRHGTSPMATWIDLEQRLGPRSLGRFFHELADRYTSDVALDPRRRWAFFAVNQVPIDANGELTTFLIDEDGVPGDAVQTIVDAPIARDTTRAGQWLLKQLHGRYPDLTIGAGQSTGAVMNLRLNTGVDPATPGTPAGDNHVTAYDPTSPRIHDAFINFQGATAVQVNPALGLSAPTVIVAGEAAGPEMLNNAIFVKSAIDAGLVSDALIRIYAIRNMPQVDADLVLAAGRMGLDYSDPALVEHARGGGERLKAVSGALLDALHRWITRGIPPPPSRFNGTRLDANGDGVVEALTFPQASGPPTSLYGFVDDPAEDTLTAPRTLMTAAQNPVPLARWLAVQDALAPYPDSVVLAETACRRGGVTLVTPGPVGTWFRPYDEQTFHAKWGSSAAHQTCRVLNADALIADGLHDPRVVTVDIVPDTFPNVIDLQAGTQVKVAIFSTHRFDATRINPSTLGMGGATLPGDDSDGRRNRWRGRARTRVTDVNGDGRLDLVADFPIAGLLFTDHDIVADVWGRTTGGIPFSGTDLVEIVR